MERTPLDAKELLCNAQFDYPDDTNCHVLAAPRVVVRPSFILAKHRWIRRLCATVGLLIVAVFVCAYQPFIPRKVPSNSQPAYQLANQSISRGKHINQSTSISTIHPAYQPANQSISRGKHINQSTSISTISRKVPYDFVGQGNCKPNRPQWLKGGIAYEQCRTVCDEATRCIGFDWDAHPPFCRVRFDLNNDIVSPPAGFEFASGDESGRFMRKSMRGIMGIEGSHTAGCFQKTKSIPFRRFLGAPLVAHNGNALVGPLPDIFDYYNETGLLGLLKQTSKHMSVRDSEVLEFNGSSGSMILPSLDAVPLLRALKKDALVNITIVVGINSDSSSFNSGIIMEASPQMNDSFEISGSYIRHLPEYRLNRNVIMFRPDMPGGQLMVEGQGGFSFTDIGFILPGWTNSGYKFNVLEITIGKDGTNEILIRSASGQAHWRQAWRHKLFNGQDIPTVYAFRNAAVGEGKPLMVGHVILKTAWT